MSSAEPGRAQRLGRAGRRALARPSWLAWFVVAALVLVVAGIAYYRAEASGIRLERYRDIATVAALKAEGIERWRQERELDVRRLAGGPFLADALSEIAATGPDGPAQRRMIQNRLELEVALGPYRRAGLLEPDGRVIASFPVETQPLAPIQVRTLDSAVATRAPALGGLHRTAQGSVRVDAMAPVEDDHGRLVAVVHLEADASDFLGSLVESWPTPSRTAETLLVRREGEELLFLSELRHRPGSAFTLREPLTLSDLPAVQAVMGRRGMFEGRDYRGVDVLADLRPIAGTAWFMVAKVDSSEILSEVRYRAGTTAGIVGLGILLAATATGLFGQRRRLAEREAAAHAIHDLASRQEALLAAVPDIVMEVDADKVYAWANKAGIDFFGDDVLGREAAFYFEGEQDTYSVVKPLFNGTADMAYVESLQRRRDGEKRLLAWWCRTLRNAHGQVTGTLSSARDITDSRRHERELEERNEELARFVYTVSHDLKSPLVTIRTFLGYLEDDLARGAADRIEKDLGFMRAAAERMARLLDELLELSRIGRKVNPPEEVTLRDVVGEALEAVAGRVAAAGARVEVTSPSIVLRGDRRRLVEVFQNLLDNAVKFMGNQASPLVEVGAERTGSGLVLFVRDNGQGIDPRHQGKVFGLFEKLQADSAGTGVGLALVKRIVEVHGGRVWVESAGPGQGSVFRFIIEGTRESGGEA